MRLCLSSHFERLVFQTLISYGRGNVDIEVEGIIPGFGALLFNTLSVPDIVRMEMMVSVKGLSGFAVEN